VENQLEVYRN